MARYDAEWVASLMTNQRRRETRPRELLRRAGVRPGTKVVDYGAGPGFFAVPATELGAHVVAVEIEPSMLALLREQGVEARDSSRDLPDGRADVVVAGLFLHDLSVDQRDAVMPELRRLLRPGGRLLVVEWVAHEPQPNRFSPAGLAELMRRHGFRPFRARQLGPTYFSMMGAPR